MVIIYQIGSAVIDFSTYAKRVQSVVATLARQISFTT